MNPLPRLMVIADGFASGRANQTAEQVQVRIIKLVAGGVGFVQLRDHGADPAAFSAAASCLASRFRVIRPELTLVVNSHPEVATRLNCGLHLREIEAAHAPLPEESTASTAEPRGLSTHTLQSLQSAIAAGYDYATFSPIFETQTHPGMPALGLSALQQACSVPGGVRVFALGGVNPERARACRDAGAYGVAVLSDLLDAADPVQRLVSYSKAGLL